MSRHAEPRSADELAVVAADMPPIDEQRVDRWDAKAWMAEDDVVDPVEDEPPYTAVTVRWRDPVGRSRMTRVGDPGGREAQIDSDAHTSELAQADGERLLREVNARGDS